jgi:hypothetical protein
MNRPNGLKVGTTPDNGLLDQSRGRRPGPLFDSENLIESWTRTYRKYAWNFSFSSDGYTVERYILYQVTIRGDGSIRVEPGDWISKYSDAIHGNPWQWSEYARKSANGTFNLLPNVHKIMAGEIIYHVPSIPIIQGISLNSRAEPSEQLKLQRIMEHLKHVRKLDKDLLKKAGDILNTINQTAEYADKALTAAEFIADLTQWSGRGASAVGAAVEVVGAAGVFLGFAMIPVQMAELGRRTYNVEVDASIAATVAFAFDDPRPSAPKSTLDNLAQMWPEDVDEYKQNWDNIVNKTYSHLQMTAVRSVKTKILKKGEHPINPELALKVGLRLAGNNDRWKLADLLRQKYSSK